jgi:DNA-binding MarR family transcriptional regulator
VPRPEVGARLYRARAQLRRGLQTIGLVSEEIWPLVRKVALDGIPALRRRVLDSLATYEGGAPVTRDIADQIDYSTGTVHRTLEDLAALELVNRESHNSGGHRWQLREQGRDQPGYNTFD